MDTERGPCSGPSSQRTSTDTSSKTSIPRGSDELAVESRFKSPLAEAGFVSSMALTQFLAEYLISGFGVLLPTISKGWRDTPISPMWPTAILSLVMSSLMLPMARISDTQGGYPCFFVGLVWLVAFSAAAGFASGEASLNACRAMQGLAVAAFQPASFALLGTTYAPGRRRNIIFGIYSAMAPLGFFGGILASGIALRFGQWSWYFWISSICAVFAAGLAYLTAPSSLWRKREGPMHMDWLGTITVAGGLVLLSYALAASPHVEGGWKSAKIVAPLLAGLALLILAITVETKWARSPLVPTAFFGPADVKPMLLAVFFFFACFGSYLFYVTFYMRNVMHASPMVMVAYFAPLAVGGIMVSVVSGSILDRIPLQTVLLFSGVMWIMSPLLIAVAPSAGYFPFVFISMICTSFGVDLTYTAASAFMSTVQPTNYQGLAGATTSVALNLAIALSLSLSSIVSASTSGEGLVKSLKAIFWFAVGLAGTGFLIVLIFLRDCEFRLNDNKHCFDEACSAGRHGGHTYRESGATCHETTSCQRCSSESDLGRVKITVMHLEEQAEACGTRQGLRGRISIAECR